MPVLKTERKTVEVKLPKSGGTVKMFEDFLTGDYRELMADESIDPNNPAMSINKSFAFILRLIAGWDFTDDKGEALEVSEANLDMLPLTDLNILASRVKSAAENSAIGAEVKKN